MLPTPHTDPTGLAALAVSLVVAVFAAVDPSGVLGDRWSPVVLGAVAVLSILAARRKAWAPASVDAAVETAAGRPPP